MLSSSFKTISYNEDYTIRKITTDLYDCYNEIKDKFNLIEYTITGDKTAEQVAYDIYGSVDDEWVLLLVNDVIDPYNGWLKSDQIVREQAEIVYANVDDTINGIHHIKDPVTDEVYYDLVEYPASSGTWYHEGDTGYLYPQAVGNFTVITNLEHEEEQNELKRTIKIIQPNSIDTFKQNIIDILNERNS